MKEIILTRGYAAKVDDEDFERVNACKWYANINTRNIYAQRTVMINGKKTTQMMHRFLLNLKDPTVQVDHINHDGLDNRRENLRVATHAENTHYQRVQRRVKSSAFKGVSWDVSTRKWRVHIRINGQHKHFGLFQDEFLAATAYDRAALELFGEFALTNAEITRRDGEAA